MGPSKQLKQIIQTEHTYKLTLLRIPTGRRQTSWLVTSVTEDLDSGLPRNKWSERDSNPGPLDCESDTLTTRPRWLLIVVCYYHVYRASDRRTSNNRTCTEEYSCLSWAESFQILIKLCISAEFDMINRVLRHVFSVSIKNLKKRGISQKVHNLFNANLLVEQHP